MKTITNIKAFQNIDKLSFGDSIPVKRNIQKFKDESRHYHVDIKGKYGKEAVKAIKKEIELIDAKDYYGQYYDGGGMHDDSFVLYYTR